MKCLTVSIYLLFATLVLCGTGYCQMQIDSINYAIDIGDGFTVPGAVVEIPIQIKNEITLGAFLIRLTYDTTLLHPLAISSQPSVDFSSGLRDDFDFDSDNITYDSIMMVGRGINTLYIDSSGLHCWPLEPVDTIYNTYAFHMPEDDPIHGNAVFIIFLAPLPPFDECVLQYWSRPVLLPETDTVTTIARLMFQVLPGIAPETITTLQVEDYEQVNPDDPPSDYRINQLTDTSGVIVIRPVGAMGHGTLRISAPCGDANYDGSINILDIISIINYAYKNGPPPYQMNLADVSDHGSVDLLDIVYLINYIYFEGPALNCH